MSLTAGTGFGPSQIARETCSDRTVAISIFRRPSRIENQAGSGRERSRPPFRVGSRTPRERAAMEPEFRPEAAAVDAALAAWRHRAANTFLAACAAVHLPCLALLVLGFGPRISPPAKAFVVAAYLVVSPFTLFRRIGYRIRLWVLFVGLYLVVTLANLVISTGPYAQIGLVVLPIFVLVLCGSTAARVAILTSLAILVSTPFLRVLPGVARPLGIDPGTVTQPPPLSVRVAVISASLASVVVLLDLFHRFLLGALAAQYRAKAQVERAAVERQRLEREIAATADEERQRLGHELHDGACQQFTAALLQCQVLRRRVEDGESLFSRDFHALSSLLAEGIGEARNIARGLCPLEPSPEALAPALRALTKPIHEMGSVRCEFTAAGDVRVPDPVMAQHLYRIAQEALSNAVRHAHAGRIAVELRGGDAELILQVEDDGTGLPTTLPGGGMGLETMAHRARMLEGELTVASGPGGTRVVCRVPRAPSEPARGNHSGEEACTAAK